MVNDLDADYRDDVDDIYYLSDAITEEEEYPDYRMYDGATGAVRASLIEEFDDAGLLVLRGCRTQTFALINGQEPDHA